MDSDHDEAASTSQAPAQPQRPPPAGAVLVGSARGSATDAASPPAETRRRALPRAFKREVRQMLYGFGDNRNPRDDTVELVEQLLFEYLAAVVVRSTQVAHSRGRRNPDLSDLRFLIRKDIRKLRRVNYLVTMKEMIEETTKKGKELESLGR